MQVIDIGSGKAELLIRLVERYQVQAIGIDRSPYFMEEARQQAAERVPSAQLELHETDVSVFPIEPASFDLVICIGACDIFGGYEKALQTLAQYVRPGGQILVGDGYWKREPDATYLAAFGGTREEFATHAENVAAGVELGLIPYYSLTSNEDDWDHYEWLHSNAIESYALYHPDDPDVPELVERIRAWRTIYLRWGRDTLGFALYLFQN
jgi:ubiquinone/menaquinone biosynthesis C-methylase UbiE